MYRCKIVEGDSIAATLQLVELHTSNGWWVVSFQPVVKPSLEGPQLSVVFFLEKYENRESRPIGFCV